MKLFAFTPSLERVGMVLRYKSLRWKRSYAGLGEFQLHAPLECAPMLAKKNILWRNDGDEAGLILIRQIIKGEDGNESVMAAGPLLSGLLARRIVWATATHSGTTETAMRWLVDNAAITTDAERVIPNLSLGALISGGDAIEYQAQQGKKVSDELTALAQSAGLGWYVSFDPRTPALNFCVRNGLDRTVGQSVNPRAVFSHEAGTVKDAMLTEDEGKHANVGLVVGEQTVTIGTATGMDRIELFIDSKAKSTVDGVTLTPEQYLAVLAAEGSSALAERPDIVTLEAKLEPNGSLVYGQDFNLGDIVTVKSKRWGVQADVRLTEVEQIFEQTSEKTFLTIGDPRPTR